MNQFFICLVLFAAFNLIYCLEFKDCGSTTGKVTAISVSGCSKSDTACDFKTGTNVTIDVTFQSEINSNAANVKIWGIIGGVPIPFNLKPSDACGHWNINCPIVKGSTNDLKISMLILRQFPKIQVEVKVALMDSDGNKMLCQQFPAQID